MPAAAWLIIALAAVIATAAVVAHLQSRLEDRARDRPCRCRHTGEAE